jgi:hypothetical protein
MDFIQQHCDREFFWRKSLSDICLEQDAIFFEKTCGAMEGSKKAALQLVRTIVFPLGLKSDSMHGNYDNCGVAKLKVSRALLGINLFEKSSFMHKRFCPKPVLNCSDSRVPRGDLRIEWRNRGGVGIWTSRED